MADHVVVDVSLVLTLHNEGELAQASLLAAERARESAAEIGLRTELVLALDQATEATRRVVDAFPLNPIDRVLNLSFGDVGASRNAAINSSRGRYVAICDGDDLLSADFLSIGARMLDSASSDVVVRPQLVVRFGEEASVGWQVGSGSDDFDVACLLAVNPWTNACIARASLFLRVPYWTKSAASQGLGYEDWHWNCETLAVGCVNVIADETIHYVRVKKRGSLNASYIAQSALVAPSRFFSARP